MTETDEATKPLNEQQLAFKRYKQGVARDGKPFFPYGVYHDMIAAVIVLAIIIGLSVVWFAQANCDSWWNVTCHNAATPAEQSLYMPGHPQVSKFDTTKGVVTVKHGENPPTGAKPLAGVKHPLLGTLYEDQADPATTQYHPRPEWYFYFLFYLLILFKNPYMVLLGTIVVPTILLFALLAVPFVDRRKERRPSRRPVAMTAMVVTAIVLLFFTYNGSKSGKETAPKGIASAQAKLPGYALVLTGKDKTVCTSCHIIGGSGGTLGPSLEKEGTVKGHNTLDWQIKHFNSPPTMSPGSPMPARAGGMSDLEMAQIAAFMLTLGNPKLATDPKITGVTAATTVKILGSADTASGK